MTLLKDSLKITIISFLVSLGSYFVFAQTTGTWAEPTALPPGNNAPAPLNAGPAGQSKSGGLILNTGGAPNGLIVNSGATSLGGQLNMNNSKIVNLQTPTAGSDAVNLGYLQNYLSAQGGVINAFNSRITGVAAPTDGTDAANRDYVDAKVALAGGGGGASGLKIVKSCVDCGNTFVDCGPGWIAIACGIQKGGGGEGSTGDEGQTGRLYNGYGFVGGQICQIPAAGNSGVMALCAKQ